MYYLTSSCDVKACLFLFTAINLGERKSVEETTSDVKSVIASTHLRKETAALPFEIDDDEDLHPTTMQATAHEDDEEEEKEAEWSDGDVPQPVEEFKEGMSPLPADSSSEQGNSEEEGEEEEEEGETEELDATSRKRSRRPTGTTQSSSSSSSFAAEVVTGQKTTKTKRSRK